MDQSGTVELLDFCGQSKSLGEHTGSDIILTLSFFTLNVYQVDLTGLLFLNETIFYSEDTIFPISIA